MLLHLQCPCALTVIDIAFSASMLTPLETARTLPLLTWTTKLIVTIQDYAHSLATVSTCAAIVSFSTIANCEATIARSEDPAPTPCTVSSRSDAGCNRTSSSYLHPVERMSAVASFPADGSHTVTLTWKYWSGSAFLKEELRDLKQESFPVRFMPTAVEFIGPTALAVSGCVGGFSVIEVWGLKRPLLLQEVSGGPSTLVPQGRDYIRLVYAKTAVGGAGYARQMIWNRGKTRSLFCLFEGETDVFELTWPLAEGLGSVTSMASSAIHPVLLGKPFDHTTSGDHSIEGYVYMFGVLGELDLQPSLVLRDSDRDGVVDVVSAMQAPELAALKLTTLPMWTEYLGLDTPW